MSHTYPVRGGCSRDKTHIQREHRCASVNEFIPAWFIKCQPWASFDMQHKRTQTFCLRHTGFCFFFKKLQYHIHIPVKTRGRNLKMFDKFQRPGALKCVRTFELPCLAPQKLVSRWSNQATPEKHCQEPAPSSYWCSEFILSCHLFKKNVILPYIVT